MGARAFRHLASALTLVLALSGCGGGSSTVTTVSGGGVQGMGVSTVTADAPVGPNTTEIVVDAGPASGFALGAANIPYVTITVCTPGSTTDCVTIDHVFVDTGSVGLRLLKSAVAPLALPRVSIAADAATGTAAGQLAECYPFVLGAVWGPMASVDLHIAGESASSLPAQLIDDSAPPENAAPADCLAAAEGGLLSSVTALQAKGVLGIGMTSMDCGVSCMSAQAVNGHVVYYSCAAGACTPAAVPVAAQMQQPVAHFAVDNNGTLIVLPALPDLGAGVAKGRLVFGIGTQSNNQIAPAATMDVVDTNPASPSYTFLTTTVGAASYPYSYIDSGSNAMFFDDASLPLGCQSSAGSAKGGWFCPPSVVRRTATVTDALGHSGQVDFAIASADALFSTSGSAFSNLGGSAGQTTGSFVWGLPFFFGRSVYTSIWGQTLATNGPWNAF